MRMRRPIAFARYWLPVLIWFVLIFAGSADRESLRHSSRIIGPIVHWLFPGLDAAGVDTVVFYVRKCAHGTEYAVLAVLWWRALRKPFLGDPRPWSWREVRLALLAATVYAASDEVHQCLVPNRQGAVIDVFIDAGGAALGLAIVWAVFTLRRRKHAKAKPVSTFRA